MAWPKETGTREVVDDVQDRDDDDERHEVPVGDVDMRLLAPRERAQVEQEIGDPDDDQPQVGIPFGFGVFLRLRHAHEIAGDGEDTEQVVAEEHEPGLIWPARRAREVRWTTWKEVAIRALPPKPKMTPVVCAGRIRPKLDQAASKARSRPGELGGRPHTHEHAEDRPGERQSDADLDRIVIVAGEPAGAWRCAECPREEHEEEDEAVKKHHSAVDAEQVVSTCCRHRDAQYGQRDKNNCT